MIEFLQFVVTIISMVQAGHKHQDTIVLIIDSTPAETSTAGKNTSYAPGYISSITICKGFISII